MLLQEHPWFVWKAWSTYNAKEQQLFVDINKESLKIVLLYRTNEKLLIPDSHAHELLNYIKYETFTTGENNIKYVLSIKKKTSLFDCYLLNLNFSKTFWNILFSWFLKYLQFVLLPLIISVRERFSVISLRINALLQKKLLDWDYSLNLNKLTLLLRVI